MCKQVNLSPSTYCSTDGLVNFVEHPYVIVLDEPQELLDDRDLNDYMMVIVNELTERMLMIYGFALSLYKF